MFGNAGENRCGALAGALGIVGLLLGAASTMAVATILAGAGILVEHKVAAAIVDAIAAGSTVAAALLGVASGGIAAGVLIAIRHVVLTNSRSAAIG
jgi:hypothetical protein